MPAAMLNQNLRGWGRKKPLPANKVNRAHPLARGLIGYWLLNENGGVLAVDASGNNHTGTITGATWVPGGLAFTTGQYVDLANPSGLSLTGDRSVFAGFRYTNAPGAAVKIISSAVDQSPTDNPNFSMGLTSSGGFAAGVDGSPYSGYPAATGVLSAGDHVGGFTLSGNLVSLCLDGTLKTAATRTTTSVANTVCNIGRYNSAIGQYFQDRIYWVAIWNRALVAAEVQLLYAEPYGLIQSPLPRRFVGMSGQALTKALTETWSLSDARTLQIGKLISEALSLLDARSHGTNKGLNEALALADTLVSTLNGGGLTLSKLLTETLTLSDLRQMRPGKLLLETLALTDGRQTGVVKALGESLGLADSRVLGIAKQIGEALGFAESVQATLAGLAVLTIVTTAAYSDALTKSGGKA